MTGTCPHPAVGLFVNKSQQHVFDTTKALHMVACCGGSGCQARAAQMVRDESGEAAVWVPD